jgi:fumarylacetoacetase
MRSWVDSANTGTTDFPLLNLPCGVFSASGDRRCGVAIGDFVLDVAGLEAAGLLQLADRPVLDTARWNEVMALGPNAWASLRARLIALLTEGAADRDAVAPHLLPLSGVQLHLPFQVAEYTDFYASIHHARNVGTMLRGAENALSPNWLSMPIGYNGRASSVVVSGTPVRRPWGQILEKGAELPIFAPTRRFDIEVELGAVVGTASAGPVSVAEADAMIFGYVLLNDWSARDIQGWEYQPLGPFQSKATATTISPWIVTAAALQPFRVATPPRERPLLPYLHEPGPMLFDIAIEAALAPAGAEETVICRTRSRDLYYSAAQQLAHHSTCGCPMSIGDLLGSGTISGAAQDSRGSLLELTWGGAEPLTLTTGEQRRFLEDGDRVTLRGHAQGAGYRIGFGDCAGMILPAVAHPAA